MTTRSATAVAPRTNPLKSPGDPLRPEALDRWLTGGSYWGKPQLELGEALRAARECVTDPRARARFGDGTDRLRAAATKVLAVGLLQRAPTWPAREELGERTSAIVRLDAAEWATYKALVALGAALPRSEPGHDIEGNQAPTGIGVCESCRGVFRPRRKAFSVACERCERNPRPETEVVPRRTTVAIDRVDEQGEPIGWQLKTYRYCEHASCERLFVSSRRDARYCSGTCRQAAHRGGAATNH